MVAAATTLLVLLLGSGGCREERELGRHDLIRLKMEALREHQGKLTPEEEARIASIHAGSTAEFDNKVETILADRERRKEEGARAGLPAKTKS